MINVLISFSCRREIIYFLNLPDGVLKKKTMPEIFFYLGEIRTVIKLLMNIQDLLTPLPQQTN